MWRESEEPNADDLRRRIGELEARLTRDLTPSERSNALLQKAVLYGTLGRNDEAVSAFNAALAGSPDLADALCELGELRYRAGDYADAETLLRRVLAQAPRHTQAKLWLGLVFKEIGRAHV